jgi:hypothetical protein
MIMVEDSILFDWKSLWNMFTGDTPYVLSGFTLATPWSAGSPANSLQVVVDNAAVVIPTDANGSYLVVPSGTPNEQLNSANNKVTGSFTPSTINYVAIKFNRNADSGTNDLVAFWDEDAKVEFTKTVPLGLILNYQFVVNTTGFGTNSPICKVQTDAFNNIVEITNSKQGLFRLGSGGSTPDPNHEWSYTTATENPLTATSSSSDPFVGGDWDITRFKEWMDAVMTAIKQIRNSAYWYLSGSSLTPGVNLPDLFFDAAASVITGEGSFSSDLATSGQLSWTSDVYIRAIIGPQYFRLLQSSSPALLTDEQVAYIELQRNIVLQSGANFTFTNGSPTVTCSVTITDALIVAGNWIKANVDGSQYWALILSVAGSTVTLTDNYAGPNSIDKAVGAVRDYSVQVNDPVDVTNSSNTFWIAKRDDLAPAPATITAADRVSNIVTITTSSPHGLSAGMMVIVSGVTDSSFDGTFEIKDTPLITTFRYDQTGADASSSGGTATKGAVIYLRSLAELEQGESRSIDDNTTQNIIDYIGAQAEEDSTPLYSTAFGSYTANRYLVDAENLTKGEKRLDIALGESVDRSNQDRNIKLIKGGTWSFNGGTDTLTWSEDAYIQVPGQDNNRNTIVAGSVVLADDEVAYVEIHRDAGIADNLTVNVANIDSVVMTDNLVIFARRFVTSNLVAQQPVDNAGQALNATTTQAWANPFVVASPTTITDVEFRLLRTGSPSGNITVGIQGDSAGDPDGVYIVSTTILASSVTLSPGESTYHITTPTPVVAGTYHLVATSDATYKASYTVFNSISIKHDVSTVTPPLEERFNGTSWFDQPAGALYFIILQDGVDEVLVGSHSFRLIDGESKELDAGLSVENRAYIGIADESDNDPNYTSSSTGSLALPNYNTTNGESLTTRAAKLTAMLADIRQDLNIDFDPGTVVWTGTNVTVTGAQLSIPGTTVGAAPVSVNTFGPAALATNSCLYVDISRTSGSALTLASSTLSALTPSQQRLVLVKNIGGSLLVR